MNRSIFKPIIGGLVLGTALFFAPFMILKLIFFFCIIGGIMRMIFWRRFMHHRGPRYYMAYADKIRGMSEDDYNAFKSKMDKWNDHCCHNGMQHCHKKDETSINPSKD